MNRLAMPATNSFRDLEVWQEAMLLVEDVYRLSRNFPADERFGLTAQLRRAAISIPSNIGEGGRRTLESQAEVDVQLELARRLSYIKAADHGTIVERVDRIGRMLNGLIESLQPLDKDWD